MVIDGLLDADVLIDLLRRDPRADAWRSASPHLGLAIPSIAWMEVVQGTTDKIKLQQAIRFMKRFRFVHYESQDSYWAMQQIAIYHLSHGVGIADVMIAAIAVRLDVPVYTRNLKHYSPLPGVKAIRPY